MPSNSLDFQAGILNSGAIASIFRGVLDRGLSIAWLRGRVVCRCFS